MSELADIKARLRRFAEAEAAGNSPLYEHLAAKAAEDDEVAGLLTGAAPGEARATLLLAVAHRLIQADPIHPLSRYYPTLGGFDGVDSETWPLFREFMLGKADRVRELVATRYTQTNEVRRAALLYPAVTMAAKRAGGPVALLEVGCSAGLLLGMDRYNYHYLCPGGDQLTAGPAKAPVGLHCAVELAEGAKLPKIPKKLTVTSRIGLDRSPVDVSDEDELAWLEACVWADQPDRVRLLRTAAAAQRKAPPELITGDAVDDLAEVAARVPADQPLVVLTSHVLTYLPEAKREAFHAALGELAGSRPLWWVSQEAYEAGLAVLEPGRDDLLFAKTALSTLGFAEWSADGTRTVRPLALTAPHGQRMTWLA
ncbi:DUF2332 domain-containing protein [Amycolatopsis suaedae]|uniref:DUF2332 domain-containing protein n=1 Tax=Amycolatopsis suaedae TaxID=2510978 RepID=A0A4Q7J788_9PSEU|nr:DUF2332 domain-containing protein [Amycolatopsis suaedae]RZQ62652.1 DUF2332 domain-containing protein [Amycolatopsis suaedae]